MYITYSIVGKLRMFHVHIVIFNSPIDTANYLLIHTDKGKVENNILPKIIAKKRKQHNFCHKKTVDTSSQILVSLILNFTFPTYPLISLNTWISLAMGHLFWILSFWNTKTISPTLKFLFPLFHFVRGSSDWRYFFLKRAHNSLTICWIRRHLFWQHNSGLLKFPVGGITTFYSMVRMFEWARGKTLAGWLMVSTVNDCEFRIPSVSAISVNRDYLSSYFPCVGRRDSSIARGALICLSQTSYMWLAQGVFLTHPIKFPPKLSMKDWILTWSISFYSFFGSLEHPKKLVPLY